MKKYSKIYQQQWQKLNRYLTVGLRFFSAVGILLYYYMFVRSIS